MGSGDSLSDGPHDDTLTQHESPVNGDDGGEDRIETSSDFGEESGSDNEDSHETMHEEEEDSHEALAT